MNSMQILSHAGCCRVFVQAVVIVCIAVAPNLVAQQIPVPRPVTDPLSQSILQPWVGDFAQPKAITADWEEVSITNMNGLKLRGWYLSAKKNETSAPQNTRTILICLGNTGNVSVMLPYAKIFHDSGFHVLMFDYQGFGASEGEATCLSLYSDVSAAFDWLVTERSCRPEDIGLFGVSLGSVLAIAIAADKNAGAVAVEDVFVPEDMMARQFGRNPDAVTQLAIAGAKTFVLPKVDPIRNVARLKCPLFLLHGANDRLLPPTGTMKVAAASSVSTRVWIMEGVGHAPESLEVNDQEYSGQLKDFFQHAFTSKLAEPKVAFTVRRLAEDRFAVQISIETLETMHPSPMHIQICVGSTGRSTTGFRRCNVAQGHIESLELGFEPDHVSAVRILNARTAAAGQWDAALSDYSTSLAEWNHCMSLLFGPMAEGMQQNDGGWFYSARMRFPKSVVKEVMSRLPEPITLPDRIAPRYAKMLARIQCWPETIHELEEPIYAEEMVAYLPADPDQYYEMGNARIDIGFRDSVVGDALYRLARHRLRLGRVEEARDLLRRHVKVLPPFVRTDLTPERIASINSLEDLDRTDRPEASNSESNDARASGQ